MSVLKWIKLSVFLILAVQCWSQDQQVELPYDSIPDAPKEYNGHNVAARMVDGLGYRYYWATEGLRDEDLNYQPGETSRTSLETIVHIYNLSKAINNGSLGQPNISGGNSEDLSFNEYRRMTLENLKTASNNMKNQVVPDMENMKVVFQRGERSSEFPFWNLINGQIADAIWHTGQIVAFRRASGNPIPPGVNVFTGKTRIN